MVNPLLVLGVGEVKSQKRGCMKPYGDGRVTSEAWASSGDNVDGMKSLVV